MFDGLREDASSSQFEQPKEFPLESPSARRRRRPGRFLGMTAMQRFVISVFIMIITCMLGTMCLLLTGRFML